MKNIRYINNHMKYHTRHLEELVKVLFYELGLKNELDYQIGLLAIDESKNEMCVGNYRDIDESLKNDLQEWANSKQRENFCGKSYYFSNKFTYKDINGDFVVVLKYNDKKCEEFVKTYLKFIVQRFLSIIETFVSVIEENRDDVVYLKNQIYVWSREFIEERISGNIICLSQLSYFSSVTAIEKISKMTYESEEMIGKFIVISEDLDNECDIVLETAVRLHETKKIRKLLQITYQADKDGLYLLYNQECIVGFISPKNIYGNYFLIEFKGNGIWRFSQEGEYSKGQGIEFSGINLKIICNDDSFEEKFRRCFQKIFKCDDNIDVIWKIVDKAKSQKHGTMLVFLDDMKEEKRRLNSAGFGIKVKDNIDKYVEQITAIDGAILMDKQGKVYAIGTILDGEMPSDNGFDMARGARYNSAIKYSYFRREQKNLIVVFSEDGYANLISNGKEI